jgi:hypothetical protein
MPSSTKHQGSAPYLDHLVYGTKVQYALRMMIPHSPILRRPPPFNRKFGTLLYCRQQVSPPSCNWLPLNQNPGEPMQSPRMNALASWIRCNQSVHHPYHASDMTYVHRMHRTCLKPMPAARLGISSVPRPQILPHLPWEVMPTLNGPVHTMCKKSLTWFLIGSRGRNYAGYLNAKTPCPLSLRLTQLGHPQPRTPMQVTTPQLSFTMVPW